MQKNINASAASTATTTGTAIAACMPGEDMVLASACRSFSELFAALVPVGTVEETALLDAVAVTTDAPDPEDADADDCDANPDEAAVAAEDVALAVGDVIVSNVVDCVELCDEDPSEPYLDLVLIDASSDDSSGDMAVAVNESVISILKPTAIDLKLFVSTLSVKVKGEPEKLWGFGEGDMMDYVCNRLIRKGFRLPWRSTEQEIGRPVRTRDV
ncbi:hypothetical protein PMZ80_002949 [Knufia obscura]|uniref:Uncharacterized protein n=1 Tax=Knufia obscura TaxID=1635080 RepID=A0ABR0RYS8_9EURO|nr:hypothetical protein PMZ80_002949 [Knufia obscura]